MARSVQRHRGHPAPVNHSPGPRSFGALQRLDRSAVMLLIFLFCVLHWALRVVLSPVYTIEDAEALLHAQSLQLGYTAARPPLLGWLYYIATDFGDVRQLTVHAVKYGLLFAGLGFYYSAARNVLARADVSAAALLAWGLTYLIGWSAHEDMLGGVALMAVLSLTLHALSRILTWRRPRDWVYLGVTLGLGQLTDHLYFVFPACVIFAGWFSSFFRDVIRSTGLSIAIGVGVAIYSPYAFWLATHGESLTDAARNYAESWQFNADWLARVQVGSLSFMRAFLSSMLPLGFFWLLLFWRLWLPMLYPMFARRSTDEEPHETAWRTMFLATILLGGFMLFAGVALGVERFRTHWMLPVVFVAPLWMFAHVKRAGEFPIAIRAFAGIAFISMGAVFVGRIAEWQLEIRMCEETGCRPYTPFRAWAQELRGAGFERGTIVGNDLQLTGNLRAFLPSARVMDGSALPAAYPRPSGNGACLAVWRGSPIMPDELASYLNDELSAPPHDLGPEGAIRRNFLKSQTKASTLYFQFVPPSEACR